MDHFPFKEAILNDQNGDIGKRWSISFWVYSVDLQKKVRKFDYKINEFKTAEKRRQFAKIRMQNINSVLRDGYHIDSSKKVVSKIMTIAEGLDVALEKLSVVHDTYLSYKSSIRLFKNWLEKAGYSKTLIQNFTSAQAYEYRDKMMNEGKVGVTINSNIAALKRMWNVLKKRDPELIKKNPWSDVEKEKEITTKRNIAWTWNEVSRLAEIIPIKDKELWQFIKVMYHTLARPKEIRLLQVYNIHLRRKKIFFEAWKTKSKQDRWINIHDSLIDTIIELIANKNSSEYLFPGVNKTAPISKNKMTDRQRVILKDLDLYDGNHTLYSWKHTGVVQAYQAGVDLKSIQLQCGHSSITETDNYLKSLGLYDNHEIIIKQPQLPTNHKA